jgi:hypothetical protein
MGAGLTDKEKLRIIGIHSMTLLPEFPTRKIQPRYQSQLIESSWVILDMDLGIKVGKARYTVEVQANWTADMMNAAYLKGIEVGKEQVGD